MHSFYDFFITKFISIGIQSIRDKYLYAGMLNLRTNLKLFVKTQFNNLICLKYLNCPP